MIKKIKYCLYLSILLYIFAICLHVFVFDASPLSSLFFLFIGGSVHYVAYKLCSYSTPSAIEDRVGFISPSLPHSRRLFAISILIILLCYIALAALFYTAWVNGDEIGCLLRSDLPLKERIILGCSCYFRWVPRIGEQIFVVGNMALNRWQHWVFSPLFLLLAAFGLWRMVKQRTERPDSIHFILLFLLIFFILFLGNGVGTWSCYRNYVGNSTYIWPTATTIFMLSYFNPNTWLHRDFKFPVFKCCLLFCLGLYSGWGTECGSVIIFPILLLWLLFHYIKKIPCPHTCLSSILGFTWGTMLLFVSTAHKWRTIKVCQWNRWIKPEEMTDDAIWDMVTNITPGTIAGLGGIDGIMLHGIPYHLHIFFLPIAAEKFWNESSTASYILLALSILSFICRSISKKKIILTVVLSLLLAWTCACSYLAQTIPGPASFVAPVYFILAGCTYLFYHLMKKSIVLGCSLVCIAGFFAAWNVIPSAIEAWEYKTYELAIYKEIIRQRNGGSHDICIDLPYTKTPENKWDFIHPRNSFIHPARNMDGACQYFGVKSIKIQSPHTQKP